VAIYRPSRRRAPALVAAGVLGALVGLAAGLLLSAGREADPEEALAPARASLQSAAGTLEVAAIEYAESVEDGEIVRPPEYRGARDALERSRRSYLEARPAVAALQPGLAEETDTGYEELAAAMADKAPDADISRRARQLATGLTGEP
jgi:hypothetical protein